MPEHVTRDQRVLYDHESDAPRRRQADDWGIDESFPRVRGRRFARESRTHDGPARRRRRPVEDWGAGDAFGDTAPVRDPEPTGPERDAGPAVAARAVASPTEEFVEIVDTPEPEVLSDGRRTIRINGRPGEVSQIAPFTSTARRRRPPPTVQERLAGDPTRIIAWAFLLGLLLILIAVLTS
jgi:hypothetical protein